MKKLISLKPRAKMALLAFAACFVATSGIQAHGGHLPVGPEFFHYVWHALAATGVVAALLVLGVFFVRRGVACRGKSRCAMDR